MPVNSNLEFDATAFYAKSVEPVPPLSGKNPNSFIVSSFMSVENSDDYPGFFCLIHVSVGASYTANVMCFTPFLGDLTQEDDDEENDDEEDEESEFIVE